MEPASIRLHLLFGRGVARGAAFARRSVVPDVFAVASAAICGAAGRHHIKPGPTRAAADGSCINQNIRTLSWAPILLEIVCVTVCAKPGSIGNPMAIYGYARVSTIGQTLAAQEGRPV